MFLQRMPSSSDALWIFLQKRLGRDTDHSFSPSEELIKRLGYTSPELCLHGPALNTLSVGIRLTVYLTYSPNTVAAPSET